MSSNQPPAWTPPPPPPSIPPMVPLNEAQIAAIAAAVREAVAAEMKQRDQAAQVLAPRTGQAAVLKFDKPFEDHDQHPKVPGVVKYGDLWVRTEDGELFNDHGQRIGRRVDVMPVGG